MKYLLKWLEDVGSARKLYLLVMKTEYLSPHAIVESIDDVEENLPLDLNNQQAATKLQQQIDILNLRNSMPIENLLNLD